MYDNVCKFLTEQFTADISTWLLGSPVNLTELSPSELSLEPIRADSLILQDVESDLVLHLEFQTDPVPEIPFRMADYRLRVYRRFPQKRMRQVVIYLRRTSSQLAWENTFRLEQLNHSFEVIRLWEKPPEDFLNPSCVGLLPFAVLSNTSEPEVILNQAAQLIEEIPSPRVKSNLVGSTAILSGLVLKEEVIRQILREDIMKESVIYQEIFETGLQRGLQRGIEQGRQETLKQISRSLLRENMTLEQVAKLTGLTIEQLQNLQDSLDNN
jgi:predicted transposase/invertase (TIGR01784 family)